MTFSVKPLNLGTENLETTMTTEEAIAALDAIDAIDEGDCERAHYQADAVLLELVDKEVREAYLRLIGRCSWWAYA